MVKLLIVILLSFYPFSILNAQFSNSELELEATADSMNNIEFPYLSLSKNTTASASCPCWGGLEVWNGYWEKENDSTYKVVLTETPRNDYGYRIEGIDSTTIKEGTKLLFKDNAGEIIKNLKLHLWRSKTKYQSNDKGEVFLPDFYDSYRYFITTDKHPNDSMFARLVVFSEKMSYTITLSKLKNSFVHAYYLKEKNKQWAIYDAKSNARLAWFSVYDPKKFYKKK